MEDKVRLINRKFSAAVLYLKGVNIIWTCGKDNFIGENE